MNSIDAKRKKRYVARRYAKAFLNVFGQKLNISDQKLICVGALFFAKHKQTTFLMQLGFLQKDLKLRALARLCDTLELPHFFSNLMELLINHKRAFLLEDVFEQLCILLKKQLGIMEFSVKSAGHLSEMQKTEIVAFLEKETGKKIFCSYEQDTSLIAGVRLQSECFLWENSIRGRLSRIQGSLKR